MVKEYGMGLNCNHCNIKLSSETCSKSNLKRRIKVCKFCKRKQDAIRYVNNRDKILSYSKQYYETHSEHVKLRKKEWHIQNYIKNKNIILQKNLKYKKTYKGKEADSKSHAKRKRNLLSIPLNNFFEGCHMHHVDNKYVIYIPKEIHKEIWHRQNIPSTMLAINYIAYFFLLQQNIIKLNNYIKD